MAVRMIPRRVIPVDDAGTVVRMPASPRRTPIPPPRIPPTVVTRPVTGGLRAIARNDPDYRGISPGSAVRSPAARGNFISTSEAVRAVQFPESNTPETRAYYRVAVLEPDMSNTIHAVGGNASFLLSNNNDNNQEEEDNHRNRNMLLAFAGEANDGYLEPRWFGVTQDQLRAQVAGLIQSSSIGTTYPGTGVQGWWVTLLPGREMGLSSAYNAMLGAYSDTPHPIGLLEFVQDALGDLLNSIGEQNVGLGSVLAPAVPALRRHLPRWLAMIFGDGPVPVGDALAALDIILTVLGIATTITQTVELEQEGDRAIPIPIPRPSNYDQCQPEWDNCAFLENEGGSSESFEDAVDEIRRQLYIDVFEDEAERDFTYASHCPRIGSHSHFYNSPTYEGYVASVTCCPCCNTDFGMPWPDVRCFVKYSRN